MTEASRQFFLIDERIFTAVHTPHAPADDRWAVICHGLFSESVASRRLGVKIAMLLCSLGVRVVRFDAVGAGNSAGEQQDFSLAGHERDLRRVVQFTAAKYGLGHGPPPLVVGLSFGGVVTSRYVAGSEVRNVIVVNSPTNVLKLFQEHASMLERFMMSATRAMPEVALIRDKVIDYQGNAMSGRLLKECVDYKWRDSWAPFRGRILIIGATEDEVVPAHQPGELADHLRGLGASVDLRLIQGSDHRLSRLPFQDELLSAVRDFTAAIEWSSGAL